MESRVKYLTILVGVACLLQLSSCTRLSKSASAADDHQDDRDRIYCPYRHFSENRNGSSVCVPCRECPPGEGVSRVCGGRRDTRCAPCERGESFSGYSSGSQRCVNCRRCRHATIRRECDVTHNALCGACKRGHFFDYASRECRRCSYCHPENPGRATRLLQCMTPDQPVDFQCLPLRHLYPIQPELDDY